MKALRQALIFFRCSILLSAAISAFGLLASARASADEVRIDDRSGILLGTADLSSHRDASVNIIVDQSSGAPVELFLIPAHHNQSAQKAIASKGSAGFSGVAAGSYVLQTNPSNVKVVSVKVSPGESGSMNLYLNAAAIGVAIAGATGLALAASNTHGDDDSTVVITSNNPAGGGVAGGNVSAGSRTRRGNPGMTRLSSRVASSTPLVRSIPRFFRRFHNQSGIEPRRLRWK